MITTINLHAFFGLAVILVLAFMSERTRLLAWASAPVVGLAFTVIAVNLGLIPTPDQTDTYAMLGGPVLSAAVFLLLLQANMAMIRRTGANMAIAFAVTGVGVFLGALGGAWLLAGALAQYDLPAIAAMYTGTYTGGGVNFNTLAAALDVTREGSLFAVAVAVDSAFTALWLAASIIVAKLLGRRMVAGTAARPAESTLAEPVESSGPANLAPLDLAVLAAATAAAIWAAQWLSTMFDGVHPLIWLTGISILAAQTALGRLADRAEPIAVAALYLFICAIGADVSVSSIAAASQLAGLLALLVTIILTVHGAAIFACIRLLGIDHQVTMVASQAAIGGPPTAIAMAEAINRPDLRIPGATAALIGYAVGTYLGLLVFHLLS